MVGMPTNYFGKKRKHGRRGIKNTKFRKTHKEN